MDDFTLIIAPPVPEPGADIADLVPVDEDHRYHFSVSCTIAVRITSW